jgi:hypothetical protein
MGGHSRLRADQFPHSEVRCAIRAHAPTGTPSGCNVSSPRGKCRERAARCTRTRSSALYDNMALDVVFSVWRWGGARSTPGTSERVKTLPDRRTT